MTSLDDEHSFNGSVRSMPKLEQGIFKVLIIRMDMAMPLGWLKQTAEFAVVLHI